MFFFKELVPRMFLGKCSLENLTCTNIFLQVSGSTTEVLCYLFFIAVYLTDVLCTDEPGLISMKSSWNWYPIDGLFFNHPKSVVVTTSSGNSRDIAERKRGE